MLWSALHNIRPRIQGAQILNRFLGETETPGAGQQPGVEWVIPGLRARAERLTHASGSGAPASHSAARLEPHPSSRSPPALTAVSRGAPSWGQEVCSQPGVGVGLRERWPRDFVVLFACFPGSLAKILGDHMPGEY